MEVGNVTSVDEFLIVGFLDFENLQVSIFITFMLIYLTTLIGNIFITATIYSNRNLHTPMYFFLTHLSFIDIGYTSVVIPKMLFHFFMEGTTISLTECLMQIYCFASILSTEFFLLTIMAYDRYVAICNPLRYKTIMNEAVCIRMTAGCWGIGLMDPIPHIILISQLSFCESHTINHFFCDPAALMKLSCTSTSTIETLTYTFGFLIIGVPFMFIITSYINIISDILKIQSVEGQRKAFSTCACHIIVIILFCGSLSSTYIRPTTTYSEKEGKVLSLLYVLLTPMCNPIIYTLKNKDFKNSIRKKNKRVLCSIEKPINCTLSRKKMH